MSKLIIRDRIFEQSELRNHCLVQFLDPIDEGDTFGRDGWPHHVTLAGVFKVDPRAIEQQVSDIALRTKPFEARVSGYDMLGWGDERTRVALLEKTNQLMCLSDDLVEILSRHNAKFKQPTPVGDMFNPHISDHGGLGRFALDTCIRFDSLSLVDLAPNDDKTQRQVVWTVPLQN